MIDFALILYNSSSTLDPGSLFTAPRVEHIEKKNYPGDDISRYSYVGRFSSPTNVEIYRGSHDSKYTDSNRLIVDNQFVEPLISKILEKSMERGFGPISSSVLTIAKKSIDDINKKNLPIHNIYPLSEGGISIEILKNDSNCYYNFSFYNDGYATMYKEIEGLVPEAMELDFDELAKRIRTLT